MTGPEPTVCDVDGGVCLICDQATPAVIVGLHEYAFATVQTGAGTQEVSVALVRAGVGDRVLVHAGEAVAVLPREAA